MMKTYLASGCNPYSSDKITGTFEMDDKTITGSIDDSASGYTFNVNGRILHIPFEGEDVKILDFDAMPVGGDPAKTRFYVARYAEAKRKGEMDLIRGMWDYKYQNPSEVVMRKDEHTGELIMDIPSSKMRNAIEMTIFEVGKK